MSEINYHGEILLYLMIKTAPQLQIRCPTHFKLIKSKALKQDTEQNIYVKMKWGHNFNSSIRKYQETQNISKKLIYLIKCMLLMKIKSEHIEVPAQFANSGIRQFIYIP